MRNDYVSPGRVEDPAVGEEAHELVWRGDHVHVRVLAVVEVSVRLPDAVEHGHGERQLQVLFIGGRFVREPRVPPRLSEVTVERKCLQHESVIVPLFIACSSLFELAS